MYYLILTMLSNVCWKSRRGFSNRIRHCIVFQTDVTKTGNGERGTGNGEGGTGNGEPKDGNEWTAVINPPSPTVTITSAT